MQLEHTVVNRLERLSKNLNNESDQARGWLDDLKEELIAKRQAEAEAQYRRDALMTRMMIEMNQVHCVELLEEMNRELLNNEGRVEPIYTTRHELCLSWPTTAGRNEIYVAIDTKPNEDKLILVVRGEEEQQIPVNQDALKRALVQVFRKPSFNVHKWQ